MLVAGDDRWMSCWCVQSRWCRWGRSNPLLLIPCIAFPSSIVNPAPVRSLTQPLPSPSSGHLLVLLYTQPTPSVLLYSSSPPNLHSLSPSLTPLTRHRRGWSAHNRSSSTPLGDRVDRSSPLRHPSCRRPPQPIRRTVIPPSLHPSTRPLPSIQPKRVEEGVVEWVGVVVVVVVVVEWLLSPLPPPVLVVLLCLSRVLLVLWMVGSVVRWCPGVSFVVRACPSPPRPPSACSINTRPSSHCPHSHSHSHPCHLHPLPRPVLTLCRPSQPRSMSLTPLLSLQTGRAVMAVRGLAVRLPSALSSFCPPPLSRTNRWN